MPLGFRDLLLQGRLLIDEAVGQTKAVFAEDSDAKSVGLIPLEDRILMSATPMAAVAEAPVEAEGLNTPEASGQDSSELPASDDAASKERMEIVFVDAGVQESEALATLDALRESLDTEYRVFELAADRDGIEQISGILAGMSDVDAVHIVSHGSAGQLQLGNMTLTNESLSGYAAQVAAWQDAMTADADLLIYGCELAETVEGEELVESLGLLTSADVAASTDATGHESRGGDWDFEFEFGSISTSVAFSTHTQSSWLGTLDVATFQEGVNGYVGTQDTYIDEGSSSASFGSSNDLAAVSTSDDQSVLIQFDNIFGSGPNQIPAGATINSVTLSFSVNDTGQSGQSLELYRVTSGWSESSDWDAAPSVAGAVSGTADGSSATAVFSGSGLVADVQAWADGDTNYGWKVHNTDSDIWKAYASEDGTSSFRPQLQVDYSMPFAASSAIDQPLVVTTTDDVVDAADLSSISALRADAGADGLISLREAIIAANNDAGHDEIILGSGTYLFGIAGDDDLGYLGDLDVTDDVTIWGNDAADTLLDANDISRLFEIHAGSFSIVDATLTGGYTADRGGAVYVDNGATLAMEKTILTGNYAEEEGGAIANKGDLYLTDVMVLGNTSEKDGGGVHQDGNIAYLERVTLYQNSGKKGGAIDVESGSNVHLTNVTISGNHASDDGGGIRNKGTVYANHVTIYDNVADKNGGGVEMDGGGAVMEIANSIIADNLSNSVHENVKGTITSLGYNIDSDGTAGLSHVTDRVGDPLLNALADNGGFVMTHSLQAGSLAINMGRKR